MITSTRYALLSYLLDCSYGTVHLQRTSYSLSSHISYLVTPQSVIITSNLSPLPYSKHIHSCMSTQGTTISCKFPHTLTHYHINKHNMHCHNAYCSVVMVLFTFNALAIASAPASPSWLSDKL